MSILLPSSSFLSEGRDSRDHHDSQQSQKNKMRLNRGYFLNEGKSLNRMFQCCFMTDGETRRAPSPHDGGGKKNIVIMIVWIGESS
jgi:hypothetical protein